jgi:Uma2 family endonuclease
MTATVVSPSLSTSQQWITATWEEYLSYVENPDLELQRIFFNLGRMWVDMGNEGINHSQVNKLLTMLLFVWFSQKPGVKFQLLGGCVIEKPGQQVQRQMRFCMWVRDTRYGKWVNHAGLIWIGGGCQI